MIALRRRIRYEMDRVCWMVGRLIWHTRLAGIVSNDGRIE